MELINKLNTTIIFYDLKIKNKKIMIFLIIKNKPREKKIILMIRKRIVIIRIIK